jgi:hypothetical protein
MTKQTKALKMAHKSFMQLNERHPRKDNGNGYFDEEIQACKEALEQPLTRDWKETIDERIAKDDEFKRALEQPSVAELNDQYLHDTYVEGLSQPAQEPVAWGNPTYNYAVHHKVEPSWQGNKEFVGLTDDEIAVIIGNGAFYELGDLEFARAIEQALKDKNHA